MFGFKKENFGCFITEIEDDIAYITLCNDDKKFYMGILLKDLKNRKIECKVGTIFTAVYKELSWLKWSVFIFSPSERPSYTKEEIEAVQKYYEDRYGEI